MPSIYLAIQPSISSWVHLLRLHLVAGERDSMLYIIYALRNPIPTHDAWMEAAMLHFEYVYSTNRHIVQTNHHANRKISLAVCIIYFFGVWAVFETCLKCVCVYLNGWTKHDIYCTTALKGAFKIGIKIFKKLQIERKMKI